MAITRVLTVLAIHGEGDREAYAAYHLKATHSEKELSELAAGNPEELVRRKQAIAPDVLVICHDPAGDGNRRVELRLHSWPEVDELKRLTGWDPDKRHWRHGAQIKLTLEDANV